MDEEYLKEYRQKIYYLLNRLEEKYSKGDYSVGNSAYMFIPTYIRQILNRVQESEVVEKKDLYDLVRCVNILLKNHNPNKEVQNIGFEMLGMIERDSKVEEPGSDLITDDDREWLDKI